MISAAIVILALVTAQRLGELLLARRNTATLLAEGAREYGRGHYPLIVLVHAAWLGALWFFAPGPAISWPLVAVFVLLQAARLWIIGSLGKRWTTRIIVIPGAPLVRRGPYRFIKHPNYWIVVLEIAILPLAFGLWQVAFVFTLLNLAVLAVRILAENRALRSAA